MGFKTMGEKNAHAPVWHAAKGWVGSCIIEDNQENELSAHEENKYL